MGHTHTHTHTHIPPPTHEHTHTYACAPVPQAGIVVPKTVLYLTRASLVAQMAAKFHLSTSVLEHANPILKGGSIPYDTALIIPQPIYIAAAGTTQEATAEAENADVEKAYAAGSGASA